jgi:hypothetical protein
MAPTVALAGSTDSTASTTTRGFHRPSGELAKAEAQAQSGQTPWFSLSVRTRAGTRMQAPFMILAKRSKFGSCAPECAVQGT